MEKVLAIDEPQPDRPEQTMKALAAGYPWAIERAEFRNDDWAVLLRDTWYYYAGGRMLPEALLDSASEYGTVFFTYNYQRELPPWTKPSDEQADLFRNENSNDNENTPEQQLRRSLAFQEALWQAGSQDEVSLRVKPVNFLGIAITVHSDIAEIVARVEDSIMAAAKIDSGLRSWITNIGELHGWNWRNIAGSQFRSNHSYGIAIDILPKSLDGKETYWQWTAQNGKEWWNIPYEDRYHPHDTLVKAFESYGFIWGGKWTHFDTMHFEYRPEILILNGIGFESIGSFHPQPLH